jgi:hypothetical protein
MGYGSVSTSIISSQEEFETFLKQTQAKLDIPLQLDAEKFVEGTMYHIDGMSCGHSFCCFFSECCDSQRLGFVADGQLRLCWPSKYLNMCLDYTHAEYNASHALHESNPLVRE